MDYCESLRRLLERLQQRRDLIQQQLEADSPESDGLTANELIVIFERLKTLNAQIAVVNEQLRHCRTNVLILGIEKTQSTQFWNVPAGQGSGAGPENGVPLIAGKPTLLRVYASVSGFSSVFPTPTSITGSVGLTGTFGTTTLKPLNGPIAAQSVDQIRRNQLDHTLNFLLPNDVCRGLVSCQATVFDEKHPADFDQLNTQLDFQTIPALPIHGVLIHYTGVDYFDQPVDAQPTGLDLAVTLDFVQRTYPINEIAYNGCTILNWSKKTAVATNFYDLKNRINVLRAMSGSNDLYAAVLPPAAGCGGTCGLGGGGAALFFADLMGQGAAHELGHALGRAHTQCKVTSGDPDPNYPKYAGYPQGSIGETGVDTGAFHPGALRLFDPNNTWDFMSYCSPVWVSPYTYMALMQAISESYANTQAMVLVKSPSVWATTTSFLHVYFRVFDAAHAYRVELLASFTLPRQSVRPKPENESEINIHALDASGRLLDAYPCERTSIHSDAEIPFADYVALLPVHNDIATLQIARESATLARFPLAPKPPDLEITAIRRDESKGDLLRVSWRSSSNEGVEPAIEFAVRFSNDGGKTWRAMACGLTDRKYLVDLSTVPGGTDCRIQIVASAGLRSAVAETSPFEVSRKPRLAFIVRPEQSSIVYTESIAFVPLLGGGFSPDFGVAPGPEVSWSTRVLGQLGTGQRIVARLPVGKHRIMLHVPDGIGGEVVTAKIIDVRRVAEPTS
jgi:hypothetical protein